MRLVLLILLTLACATAHAGPTDTLMSLFGSKPTAANFTPAFEKDNAPPLDETTEAHRLYLIARDFHTSREVINDAAWATLAALYEKAAAAGHWKAMVHMVGIHESRRDYRLAWELNEKLVALNVPVAHYNKAAHVMRRGEPGRRADQKKGLELMHAAAALGSKDAQYWLGEDYIYIKHHDLTGLKYHLCAARQGHGKSAYAIGFYLQLEKNYPMAVEYYLRAGSYGDSGALLSLATIFDSDNEQNNHGYARNGRASRFAHRHYDLLKRDTRLRFTSLGRDFPLPPHPTLGDGRHLPSKLKEICDGKWPDELFPELRFAPAPATQYPRPPGGPLPPDPDTPEKRYAPTLEKDHLAHLPPPDETTEAHAHYLAALARDKETPDPTHTQYLEIAALYRRAADRGHWKAMRALIEYLVYIPGKNRDYLEAHLVALRLAALDIPAGHYYLGLSHIEGWAAHPDLERGMTHIRRAAAQGNPEAQYTLGEYYIYAHKQPARGRLYHEAAARQNHAPSISALAALADIEKNAATAEPPKPVPTPARRPLPEKPDWFDLCAHGTAADITKALAAGADINARDPDDYTGLMNAIYFGNTDTARALLEAGANPSDQSEKSRATTASLLGVQNDPGMVALIDDAGGNIDTQTFDNNNAIMLAAWKNRAPVVRALLARDANTHNALYGATITTNNTPMIELLLDAGADINRQAYITSLNRGWLSCPTALQTALQYHHDPATIRMLLARGANIHTRSSYLLDAAMFAAMNSKTLAPLQAILERRPIRADTNQVGLNALEFAARFNPNPDIARALVAAGWNPRHTGEKKMTLLMHAAHNPGENMVRYILTLCDVNATTPDGDTALRIAAGYNPNPKVIKLLIESGAGENQKGKALLSLVFNSNYTVAKALFETGAPPDMTPLLESPHAKELLDGGMKNLDHDAPPEAHEGHAYVVQKAREAAAKKSPAAPAAEHRGASQNS